jgi:hypothetical protein
MTANDFTMALQAKSDQINALDLVGIEKTITITGVSVNLNSEQPISIRFAENDGKVYRPCKGMGRVMMQFWGGNPQEFIGKKLTLFCDPDVRFGKDVVGGIRIKAMSHIPRETDVSVKVTQKSFKRYTIAPIRIDAAPAAIDPSATQAEAREVAGRGTAAFRNWWGANPDKREACKAILPELQSAATTADETLDEFGLPPADDRTSAPPTDEIHAMVLAEVRERDARLEGGE